MNIHTGKRNSPSLVIRTVTLIFNHPARYSETKFESKFRGTNNGDHRKMEVLSYINNKIEEIFLTQERIVFS